jgi:hypothetical protein
MDLIDNTEKEIEVSSVLKWSWLNFRKSLEVEGA